MKKIVSSILLVLSATSAFGHSEIPQTVGGFFWYKLGPAGFCMAATGDAHCGAEIKTYDFIACPQRDISNGVMCRTYPTHLVEDKKIFLKQLGYDVKSTDTYVLSRETGKQTAWEYTEGDFTNVYFTDPNPMK